MLAADPEHVADIVTRPPGWMLQIPAQRVDAERFSTDVADARTLAAAGKAAEAADVLSGTLGLWSGEPLADIADVGLAVEDVGRLQELRLEASELLTNRSWQQARALKSSSLRSHS